MIDLWEGAIKTLPKKHIDRDDCLYLGWVDNYVFRLVVEEGVMKIYNYEEWYYDDIFPNHEHEDWWAQVRDYIGDSESILDLDTVEYILPKFECEDSMGMANEIVLALTDKLEDVSYQVQDNGIPTQKLIDFIDHCKSRINQFLNGKIYLYYK